MKAVLLAGGHGTRMLPFTKTVNKHLSPVYLKNKAMPMIEYPLDTLVKLGVKEVLIITSKEHCGSIVEYLGNGKDRNLDLTYKIQDMEKEAGIAGALKISEKFVGNECFLVILGDNYFEYNKLIKNVMHNIETSHFTEQYSINPENFCGLFLKEVNNPQGFGVAIIKDNKIKQIIEKPKTFISNKAITGLYIYIPHVFEIISTLKPSKRGELEISDINNYYCKNKNSYVFYTILDTFWSDLGVPQSMIRVIKFLNKNE